MKPLILKIKVISRIDSPRRSYIKNHLDSKNITFSFLDAADTNNIKRDNETFYHKDIAFSLNFNSNNLDSFNKRGWIRIGEIGCMYSHYSLWKELIKDECDGYFILEDDAEVLFDNNILNDFLKNEKFDDIDVIYCQKNSPNYVNGKSLFDQLSNDLGKVITNNCNLYETLEGTTGYIVSKSGAKKLISSIENIGLTWPADNYIMHSFFDLSMDFRFCPKYLQVQLSEVSKITEIHSEIKEEKITMIRHIKYKENVYL